MSYYLRMNYTDVILKSIVSKELKTSHGSTKTKNNKNKNVKEVTLLFLFLNFFGG